MLNADLNPSRNRLIGLALFALLLALARLSGLCAVVEEREAGGQPDPRSVG
jgi:hypothetical protein